MYVDLVGGVESMTLKSLIVEGTSDMVRNLSRDNFKTVKKIPVTGVLF